MDQQTFIRASVLVLYFLIVMVLGLLARSRIKDSPSQYFLAGRGLGTFVLIGTMAATNFSAFTVFGASGAGYRDGLAFFPIMAFGTGFMALTFWLIGRKVWQVGKEHGLVTPPELVKHVYGNRWLGGLFAIVMVIFTVPYLAIQPWAGGFVLNQLFDIPQFWGATIVTSVILVYTLRGGLKAVAWTDVFQGFLMVGLMLAALVVVAGNHGGLAAGFGKVMESNPDLFSRPGGIQPDGGAGKYGPGIWFSFMLLWFLCDPMFPQLFQRFYTAKSEKPLAMTMLWYPVICTLVFILPISLGLLGRLEYPGLVGKEADNIVPMLMTGLGNDFMGTLVLAGGLAGLMSTMDSQLLTLSSIFTRDIVPFFRKRHVDKSEKVQNNGTTFTGRIFVGVLAVVGLIIAANPPGTILDVAAQTFTGLAVLFPTVLFGLYLKNPRPAAAIVSILVGEGLVIAYAIKLLPTFGFLPVVPVIVATVLAYMVIHLATGSVGMPSIKPRSWMFAGGFAVIFILAMDFWRWGEIGPIWFGLPAWVWWFVGLSALQTVLMIFWVRKKE